MVVRRFGFFIFAFQKNHGIGFELLKPMETTENIDQSIIRKRVASAYEHRTEENITFHHLNRLNQILVTLKEDAEELFESENARNQIELAIATYYSTFWFKGEDKDESAKTFLEENFSEYLGEKDVDSITRLSLSINDHNTEKTTSEAIIYDIYWSFLGKKKLVRNLELLAIEHLGDASHKKETLKEYIEVISAFRYRTKWAIKEYSERKSLNTRKVLSAIEKEEKKRKKQLRRSHKLGRGIETMYRSVYKNHVNLSAIADAKANLIIRVNTIIMSIIVTLAGTGYTFFDGGFYKYSRFTAPVLVLLLGSLAAVIFAVLSARPKVTRINLTKQKIRGNDSSLLFFGNYINLDKKDFIREMSLFRQDKKRVYDQMSVDIYYLGLVLDRKYRLVTISYNIFMVAIALSVLSFITIFSITQFS